MSLIGEALNNKVSNDKSKNAFYYSDYIYGHKGRDVKSYTYSDLKDMVDLFINYIKKNYNGKKTCFLIIDNSIEDIAFFIALMELNIKPIIIHKDKLIELYLSNKDVEYMELNPNIDNIHMPFDRGYYGKQILDYTKEAPFISNSNIRSSCYLSNIKNEIKLEKPLINRMLYYYLRKNELLDLLDGDDYDFGILTSGTTNNFKIQKVKEKELYDKIIANYDVETEEAIINTTPISSISGLIFNLYIPLLSNNNKKVCVSEYLYYVMEDIMEEEKGLMSIVLPGGRNLFEYIGKKDAANMKINHVYFMGKKITLENIETIHEYAKTLSDDCIYNYYGNTENLGLICKCGEKHLKPVYIYGLYITNDKMIYSEDKENVYIKTIENGKITIKKLKMKFDERLFVPILPISDDYKRDSKIINLDEDNVFGELLVNDEKTGDFGFEYNNLLYLVGRNNEFIQEDNRYIFLSSLENAIWKDCVIARKDSTTNVYAISDDECLIDDCQYKYSDTYARLAWIKDFLDKHKVSIDNYVIIDRKDLPTGVEIGKIKKDFLLQYISPKLDPNKFDKGYDIALLDIFNKQLSLMLGRLVKTERKNKRYVFDKKHFNFLDILTIISNYQTYDFCESDDCYYLSIADSFMLAKHPRSIKPVEDIYSIFKSVFDSVKDKTTINITFRQYSETGTVFNIYKSDYLEPLTIDYNSDKQTIYNNYKDEIVDKDDVVRYMVRDKDNNTRLSTNPHSYNYHINVPFYFIAYMKDGKIYLEEYYKVQDEYKETSNKVYKIKKR